MKRFFHYLYIITICIFPAALCADQQHNRQQWQPVLSDMGDRVAASKQAEDGLLMLIYAPGQDIYNLVYLPNRAQLNDPVISFISASITSGDNSRLLDHAAFCFDNQAMCHDHEHVRIGLSAEDLKYFSTADELHIRYQSRNSAARNTAWTASIPLSDTEKTLENLALAGQLIRTR